MTAPYMLDFAPEQHQKTWRAMNDRDVRGALALLEQLGALRRSDGCATLTELGWWGMRRAVGDPGPGGSILQVKISLAGMSEPPVWRRLLVPAEMRLDRFHQVIQAALAWEDYHLHVFSDGSIEYGLPEPELGHRDERQAKLTRLLKRTGDRLRYTYDFGDDWEHDIVVEQVLTAEHGGRYPICLAGQGACPPEDCGGVSGYEQLREVLADPADAEHEAMLEWLGLETASEFDPARFEAEESNAALGPRGAVVTR